ncbi:LacI family DNA-binding transcriptional regulator [Virgisporangium ochraceum]|uniref:Alanine racemase n=1 Tax=Virgisporangium ochraceum TaxID=65505 RepID=A0A8J3ZQ44_9ACTN|nr:LacI family DNA-binding transcriptional regulator [Virgisporangium ochraceum]GIJ66997.1 alanine racemase [Virgisporangium ochraceum]
MPERPARLVDVAARAGVSRTTASFVLSGRTDMGIAAATAERVRRAARELDYRPNLMSHGLRTRQTRTIALVSDTVVSEPYAGQLVYGALAAAAARGHRLFIGETGDDPALRAATVDDFLDRQVDGIVLAALSTGVISVPRAAHGRPLVLLNGTAARRRVCAVLPDERGAGRTAARALLDHGHRDGVYLVGERAPWLFAGRERLAGIVETLAGEGIGLAGTVDCYWWPEPAYEATARLLRDGVRPRAVICLNDRIAFGVYQALQEAGLVVPDDVSVVSFDDSDLARWLRPGLTSIALPHAEMGRRAVELLLDGAPPTVERIPMPLAARSSVARA